MTSNQNQQYNLDRIIQQFRQHQLSYKTKIIQLQKQKQYEANRANEFQLKFKEALLQNGNHNEDSLLKQLYQKDHQINNLRMQVIKLKKNIDQNSNQNQSQSYKNDTKNLISQNQQMAKTIQQLKSAAISAIISKDDQIQQLTQKLQKFGQLTILYQNLLQRQQFLQKQLQQLRIQSQQEHKALSQKLIKERQKYLQKLQEFQNNLQQEQSSKQILLQKAMSLQDHLQTKQKTIQHYQNKILDYENHMKLLQQNLQQDKQKLLIEIDNLKDRNFMFEKEQKNYQKIITEYKIKQKQSKIMYDKLKDQNAELIRKLSIKKRKHNPKMRSSDIFSSFQGISQKSSFYSSFYQPTQNLKPTTLGDIKELQQNDIVQNFIDLDDKKQIQVEPTPKVMKKKAKIMEVELGSHIQDQQIKKTVQNKPEQQIQVNPKQQTQTNNNQLQNLRKSIQELQNQIKSIQGQNRNIKKQLQEAYTQIQKITLQLNLKNEQILKQRQAISELRSQNKKSQSQKQLIFQLQNFKQHIFKLQNALLIQKLQNAEKEQFMRERIERQKKLYEDKINKLSEEVQSLTPKKKKGFFGR